MLTETIKRIINDTTSYGHGVTVDFPYIDALGDEVGVSFRGVCCGNILENGRNRAGIILKPLRHNTLLSKKDLLSWVKNCLDNKGFSLKPIKLKPQEIITQGIPYFWKDISKRDFYIALGLMRFGESSPQMVKDINALVADGVNFWQAIYMCHGLRMTSSHYSFMNVVKYINQYDKKKEKEYADRLISIDSMVAFMQKMMRRKHGASISKTMMSYGYLGWNGQMARNTPALNKVKVDAKHKMFSPHVTNYMKARTDKSRQLYLKQINSFTV